MAAKTSKNWISRIGDVSAWVSVLAFLAMFVAETYMEAVNPHGNGPWPDPYPRPTTFQCALWVRNLSLPTALLAGLIALPRRKAIASLLLTVLYTAYVYLVFVHY